MSKTKPLSAAQQRVITLAASRASYAILPLPEGMPARGAVPQRLVAALLAQQLIEERSADGDAIVWRREPSGTAYALALTQRGLEAAGPIEQGPAAGAQTDVGTVAAAPILAGQEMPSCLPKGDVAADAGPATSKVPTGKLGQVVVAISADLGATLDELVTLTGWLPHTTRAALTRLRQRGYPVALARMEGRNAYRLKPAAAAAVAPTT